ncbi:uncharacterized protein LOC124140239 [Haliotis rufescens]|uniref:uncharacterized protein LOC124140239 n=1 Tax=Haliotis rufescens TaxID=6454 RepID=UPI00201E9005|nr:uncharacterized protein LOC124140239 [Haliotis rufescens]
MAGYMWLTAFALSLAYSIASACPDTVNYTTSQTISSHDYPKPYPQGVRCTWVWQADSGLWGVNFTDVDLNKNDYLMIDVGNGLVVRKPHSSIYSPGPSLKITFTSGNSATRGRGFRINVLYGKDKHDLDRQFRRPASPPPSSGSPDTASFMPLLLGIAMATLFLFFAVFIWVACRRHRRQRQIRQQQEVSLSVNVQSIRRDSGVKYTRKASTNSQSEDPPCAKKTNQVARSNSNRSWAVRAELTSTTTTTPCDGDGHPHTVHNLYTPIEKMEMLKAKQMREGQGQIRGHIDVRGRVVDNQTGPRDRVGTLERVPENTLLMKIPTSGIEPDEDDGYLGPSAAPKLSSSYLHCPVTLSPDLNTTRFGSVSSSASCDSGYHNFTVVGRVDLA